MSKRSTPSGSGTANPSAKKAKKRRADRSVWNTPDDWDTLLAESTLSTSSISTRRPKLRGLPTLAKCCQESAARSFKRLWEAGQSQVNGEVIVGPGRWWKDDWAWVPDHLKVGVRDAVFRYWGGSLSLQMLQEVFTVAPELYLPGVLLPAVASTKLLKPVLPPESNRESFIKLVLTYAPQVTDVAIAGLIYNLPNLEIINLKGCSLAASKTVDTIIKRCPSVRCLNLKGTRITASDVQSLLDEYGQQLSSFKIDNVNFDDTEKVFTADAYPYITHLCLPGNVINRPANDVASRARLVGHTVHPNPRPAAEGSHLDWPRLGEIVPALTQLYLPGLLIPAMTHIALPPNQLQKLVLGLGPPVPTSTLSRVILEQAGSLRHLQIGNLIFGPGWMVQQERELSEALGACTALEVFRFEPDQVAAMNEVQSNTNIATFAVNMLLQGSWRASMRLFSVRSSALRQVNLDPPLDEGANTTSGKLEQLHLPDVQWNVGQSLFDREDFLNGFPALRELDVSGSSITEEQLFRVLDGCPMLCRIDLTTCRGINVRNRRRVFEAWTDARAKHE